MFKKQQVARAQKMLLSDKWRIAMQNPQKAMGVLKSDLFNLLKDYMELERTDLMLNLDFTQNGEYILTVQAKSLRMKEIGRMD